MKLYYIPGACSLASHIALREAGASFDLDRLDNANKKTEAGEDYLAINPKGYVPALSLDDGDVLTEGAAILQFIADQHPASGLAPAAGSRERVHLQENLNFIATEFHKAFSPLFKDYSSDVEKDAARAKVRQKLDQIDELLSDGRDFLQGDRFTVADAYLFTIAQWTGPTGIGLADWPHLSTFCERIAAREAVQQALKAEGLAA